MQSILTISMNDNESKNLSINMIGSSDMFTLNPSPIDPLGYFPFLFKRGAGGMCVGMLQFNCTNKYRERERVFFLKKKKKSYIELELKYS